MSLRDIPGRNVVAIALFTAANNSYQIEIVDRESGVPSEPIPRFYPRRVLWFEIHVSFLLSALDSLISAKRTES